MSLISAGSISLDSTFNTWIQAADRLSWECLGGRPGTGVTAVFPSIIGNNSTIQFFLNFGMFHRNLCTVKKSWRFFSPQPGIINPRQREFGK
jgi:hypothetical protein